MIDKVLIFAFLSTSVGTKKILSCRLHLVKLFLFFFLQKDVEFRASDGRTSDDTVPDFYV